MISEEVTNLPTLCLLWGGKTNALLSGLLYNCPSTGTGEKLTSFDLVVSELVCILDHL